MDEPSAERQRWVIEALEQYERRLLRFAARMTGDEDSARDAVQHTFLRLCGQSPESLNGRLGPWLFAVCRNRAVDQLRAGTAGEASTECEDRSPSPDETAERADLFEHVNRQVDRLPPSQREALALWAEGFSYRQIAAATDATEGNVRVTVHRALKSLRQRLKT